MALKGLLRIASSQLRLLSVGTRHEVTSLADQPLCCCHDDSKGKKSSRPQSAGDRKFSVKAAGAAVNMMETTIQDILREQERQEKLQARSSLQRRQDLLLSLGCTMDQIQNKVKVLELSEQVILQRASMLKEIGCSVNVNLLMSPYFTSLDTLRKHVQHRAELDSAICTVLQCSMEDLDGLKAKHPLLNRFRGLTGEDLMEKGRILHSYGITSKEIRAVPAVLNIKIENIRQRLDTMKALREKGSVHFEQYPLKTIAQRSTREFDKCIKNAMLGTAELDGSRISLATIAQRLGVTAKEIEDASINFYKMGPSTALKKLDYLLGEGIPSVEIVSHIYIMKYHLQNLQRAVEKSKSVLVSTPPPIYIVLSFLRSGHLPRGSHFVWSRQRKFIATLFGVQSKELPNHAFLRPLWSMDRVCIKRNFDFLISEGFSEQEIFSCLVLLGHDPDHLQAHYLTLWERPELAEHVKSEAWTDKKQMLSLLQYMIEKDMDFKSTVYNAEVEVEPVVLEKEEHVEDRLLKKEPQNVELALIDQNTVWSGEK